ncbi:unnamed protein product [Calypogeia fissa]
MDKEGRICEENEQCGRDGDLGTGGDEDSWGGEGQTRWTSFGELNWLLQRDCEITLWMDSVTRDKGVKGSGSYGVGNVFGKEVAMAKGGGGLVCLERNGDGGGDGLQKKVGANGRLGL